MTNEKKTVELVLEGVELTAEAKAKIEAQMAAIITEKTGKRVAFILERKLAEAKLNIYRAVKERAKSAYMEALGLIRGEMQNDAVAFKTQLEEKLNDFLSYSMKKLIPDDIIKEASQAKHYKELVEKVKKVIVIDELTKDSEVREAVADANDIIEKLKSNNNKLMKEKIRIHNRAKQAEAELHLEKKTRGMTDAQKKFVTESLKGKGVEEIDNLFESTMTLMTEKAARKPVSPTPVKTVTNPTIVTEDSKKRILTQATRQGAQPAGKPVVSEMGAEMEDYISVINESDEGKI